MKRTLLVYSCARTLQPKTAAAISACAIAGAGIVEQGGTSDVSVARNAALTMACRLLEADAYDVALMVDDDMGFTVEQARQLADHVRKSGFPASGCYVVGSGKHERIAAMPHSGKPGRWLTGLGFLAIPARLLLRLRELSPLFACAEGELHEFTSSGVTETIEGRRIWLSEDVRLTARLGGVELLPIAVDHFKTATVRPNAEALPAFIKQAEAAA